MTKIKEEILRIEWTPTKKTITQKCIKLDKIDIKKGQLYEIRMFEVYEKNE